MHIVCCYFSAFSIAILTNGGLCYQRAVLVAPRQAYKVDGLPISGKYSLTSDGTIYNTNKFVLLTQKQTIIKMLL